MVCAGGDPLVGVCEGIGGMAPGHPRTNGIPGLVNRFVQRGAVARFDGA